MLAPVGEQSGFISFYRIQLYQQLAEKGSAPLRRRKLRNYPAELAAANWGRIPLKYLPNPPTLNGRRILFTLLFFWPFGS